MGTQQSSLLQPRPRSTLSSTTRLHETNRCGRGFWAAHFGTFARWQPRALPGFVSLLRWFPHSPALIVRGHRLTRWRDLVDALLSTLLHSLVPPLPEQYDFAAGFLLVLFHTWAC